jgi:hypothetical protein
VAVPPPTSGNRYQRRSLIGLIGVAIVVLAVYTASSIGTLLPGNAAAATASAAPSTTATSTPAPTSAPTRTPTPTTEPSPSAQPTPGPVLVPAPLTGLPVTEVAALRHPIAVMIDDHADARPQSGFNAASVVWHAPAEFGIPRYMLIFQDRIPASVGPVRSARQYYIQWAAEVNAMYVHAGGSPQALATLRAKGNGQWVYNADQFRWGGTYLWRTTDRFAPHNVYTDGESLRALARRVHATDGPVEPIWTFKPERARELRPIGGGRITVVYPYESITYRYNTATNRYVRYIDDSTKPQVDRADGRIVAPKNVVILRMHFGPLDDGHPEKQRQEARNIGKGEAWVASNGITIKAQWRKASSTAPTRLFTLDGQPIVLAAGQTFVQVIATTYAFEIKDAPRPVWLPPQHWDP